MANDGPVSSIASLRKAAQRRLGAVRNGKTRVVVQLGHCSASVGAQAVADALSGSLPNDAYLVVTGCDGACYAAPQVVVTAADGTVSRFARVTPDSAASIAEHVSTASGDSDASDFLGPQRRVTTDGCGDLDATSVDEYLAGSGFDGLAKALTMPAEDVIEEVSKASLRGRGGAYFPAAIKWRGARGNPGRPKYLVVNCEEGEPGIFKDRHLMEGVPYRLLEGALIAAYAAGLDEVYLYVNAEANLSAERVQSAIDRCAELGLIGENLLGSDFSVRVEIRRGAGGYVCGDETALLNTMEGWRREPRLKDPLPVLAGLWARPTVINNAETLSSVPFILANGADAFTAIGTEEAPGTKLICLSGSVQRPGLAEVPMGTTLREIIHDIGGGPEPGHEITTLAVGGPSSGVMPASMIDTAIKPGTLHEAGVMLGAGGVIPLDERVDVLDVVRDLAQYNADESCGKCTPCREGTPRQVAALDRLMSGNGSAGDIDELRELSNVINAASLCGLGQMAGNPIISALHFYGERLAEKAGIE